MGRFLHDGNGKMTVKEFLEINKDHCDGYEIYAGDKKYPSYEGPVPQKFMNKVILSCGAENLTRWGLGIILDIEVEE